MKNLLTITVQIAAYSFLQFIHSYRICKYDAKHFIIQDVYLGLFKGKHIIDNKIFNSKSEAKEHLEDIINFVKKFQS